MSSIVREFSCQYSDQIRKKHKTWHDGKLRYIESSNRFLLFTDDGVQLCSKLITSNKHIAEILNEEGYGIEEHRIFGSFYVIILELLASNENSKSQCVKTTAVKTEVNDLEKHSTEPNLSPTSRTNHKRVLKSIVPVSDSAKKPFKLPIPQFQQASNARNAHVKLDPALQLEEDGKLSRLTIDEDNSVKNVPFFQEYFRSSLNVSQMAEYNISVSANLDPVEYMRRTNSILRTGRLRQKNYVVRNSPIVL
ncbi:unnamed protein product [Kluyveromyces dobzhanskii CBS 2104]|uniref:WGS project CCBQ000000000 data, contig 00017 n=1 Tax=Kluyveromyces dobzhanskii CBS 2104 TaxID=1427455 RepID=A0A0A8L6G8_9SACH|nr:unnamed protein product [Kluyveromyces dobzhanskii CBS 2104]